MRKRWTKGLAALLSVCMLAALPGGKTVHAQELDLGDPYVEEAFEGELSGEGFYGEETLGFVAADDATALLTAFVERLYSIVLGRASDAEGLQNWVGQLQNHISDGANLAHGFFHSEEFQKKSETMSDEDYVKLLYETFFNRDADEGGFKNWMNALASGSSRDAVLMGFVDSDEFSNLCERYGILRGYMDGNGAPANAGIAQFVYRLYEKALGRKYDAAGLNDWTGRIATGEVTVGYVATAGFFYSEEFQSRSRNLTDEAYLEVLYQTFFDRAGDSEGLAYWKKQIGYGAPRNKIIFGFANSSEFRSLVESFGLVPTEEEPYIPYSANPLDQKTGIKGVQGDTDSYPQGFMNVNINDYIWTDGNGNPIKTDGGQNIGEPYEFEGKTYYLSGDLMNEYGVLYSRIRKMNQANQAVNAVFLMQWDPTFEAKHVLCDASAPGSAIYYLPASSGEGANLIRAFWDCLASGLARYDLHIDNYIFGNEANARFYCYEESFDVTTKATKYAEGYHDMYEIVTKYNPDTRCSIAIDHSWNLTFAPQEVLPAKAFLDVVANNLNAKGDTKWFISTHMYPAKVDCAILWDGNSSVTGSVGSEMFDARNMKMVTEYVKNTYGAQHRFMLTENGFEAGHGEEAQAAALAYSYYVAKYNDMIDNFILNVERGGIDFAIDGRLAGKVWNYLDDGDASHKAWIDSTCLPVIGAGSWSEIVPGYSE
ncbi:MAG: DUF4214 domain-containing protein [Lachnospiraceae bacterium]|nr:DUF4214 domain-containing protein [Lachnospiraceae bacterium]